MDVKVLIIEDDPEDLRIFETYLKSIRRTNFTVNKCSLFEDALEQMISNKYDVYILDYFLGKKSGLELMREAVDKGFSGPVIFLTGRKNSDTDLEVLGYGAYDYLIKDYVNPEVLERSIRYTLSRSSLEKKVKDQNILLENIITSMPVGLCVTDDKLKIKYKNNIFLNMFDIKENDLEQPLDSILFFDRKKDDIFSGDYQELKKSILQYTFDKTVNIEGRVSSKNMKNVHCIMKYKAIKVKNGKERIYRIFTFINIEDFKNREDKLINTVESVQRILEKYADRVKDPRVFIDLSEIELIKMGHSVTNNSIGV